MSARGNPFGKRQAPRFIQLIRRRVLTMVFGVMLALALIGHFGLEQFIYTRANDNLQDASLDRYKAEIQHLVETVVATIEATIPLSIGAELNQEYQEEIKRLVRRAKFDEGNGYFFLYDMQGLCIAHGDQPDREGQVLLHLKDPDGKPVIQLLRNKARYGGGFEEYKWEKPHRQGTFPKISYAQQLRGGEWWLGSGVYMDDINRTL